MWATDNFAVSDTVYSIMTIKFYLSNKNEHLIRNEVSNKNKSEFTHCAKLECTGNFAHTAFRSNVTMFILGVMYEWEFAGNAIV